MIKHVLSIALASVCALSVSAQTSESLISEIKFSVDGQTKVENPYWDGSDKDEQFLPNTYSIGIDSKINMEFVGDKDNELTQTLGFQPYVMLTTGGGFSIDGTFYSLANYMVDNNPSMYAFSLSKEKWGNPYMGAYNATPMVCFLKRADGELPKEFTQQELAEDDELAMSIEFYMVDDEPVFFLAPSYTTKNIFKADFLGSYPNDKLEDETFTKAYTRGEIVFSFNNEVSFLNSANIGTITYYTTEGDEETTYITQYESGYSQLDGFYTVTFDYKSADFDAEDLDKIVIQLSGVQSMGKNVTIDPVTLENISTGKKKQRVKTSIESDWAQSSEFVTVYNLQGTLVKENIKRTALDKLAPGLYIIDGKKIIIR